MNTEQQIEEMARKNCHIEYHMRNYKTCKECYEANYRACRVYEVCRNHYNEGYRKQEWISVEERLPDKDGEYLTWDGLIYFLIWFNASLGLWNVSESGDTSSAIRGVTHWMPLPEPPKMKGE